ncbi:MAG TPA: class I SAM-dependent methyltransferase [Kineosporiaceae bacterium]|nr:class I SAM-dependent methyltransferase [Kineosporiaceae bacterium]
MEGTEVRKLTELEDRHWWYRERRALVARALRGLRPGVALDVGAAGGGNTRVLQAAGWRAAALEYGADGAQVCAERGIPVVRGDATRLPCAPGSLDLVVAFDVLEHIDDDATAAKEIFELLRPGGVFLVAVPCDPTLWSAHDEAVGHVRRYTRAELISLLSGAGFSVDEVRSWMVLLRPAVAVKRRSSTGSDLDDPPGWLNAVLGALVATERWLPVGGLPGVSLLVTARRP